MLAATIAATVTARADRTDAAIATATTGAVRVAVKDVTRAVDAANSVRQARKANHPSRAAASKMRGAANAGTGNATILAAPRATGSRHANRGNPGKPASRVNRAQRSPRASHVLRASRASRVHRRLPRQTHRWPQSRRPVHHVTATPTHMLANAMAAVVATAGVVATAVNPVPTANGSIQSQQRKSPMR